MYVLHGCGWREKLLKGKYMWMLVSSLTNALHLLKFFWTRLGSYCYFTIVGLVCWSKLNDKLSLPMGQVFYCNIWYLNCARLAGFWGGLVPDNAYNASMLEDLLEAGALGLKVRTLVFAFFVLWSIRLKRLHPFLSNFRIQKLSPIVYHFITAQYLLLFYKEHTMLVSKMKHFVCVPIVMLILWWILEPCMLAFVIDAHAWQAWSKIMNKRNHWHRVQLLKSFMCPSGINDFPATTAQHIQVGRFLKYLVEFYFVSW